MMGEPESLDQQALMEQPPDYQATGEDDLLGLFLQYEEGTPMYDRYIDQEIGGNFPVHASTRLSAEVFEYIEDSGEAVSQWIREACETRYREETQ